MPDKQPMRRWALAMLVSLGLASGACGAPRTFVKTTQASWNTISLREDLAYPEAWKMTVDTIAQRFDIEVISQESGYLRTAWDYKWTGDVNEKYRVRATIKFSESKRYVQVRSDAEYRGGDGWVMGEDDRLTSTLKTDLMGKIGTVTR